MTGKYELHNLYADAIDDMISAGIPEAEARAYLEKATKLVVERAVNFEHDARRMLRPETYRARAWVHELIS